MSTVSQPQLAANINNALLSTGPRTETGKRRSAQNAVRHALFAQTIPAQHQEAHQRLLDEYRQDLRPAGATEEQLVVTIADAQWRLLRCRELQASLLFADTETPDAQLDALNKYSLYEHRLTRVLQSNMKELLSLLYSRSCGEKEDMLIAARIAKPLIAEGKPYDPAADGFVFSADDFARYLHREEGLLNATLADSRRSFSNSSQKPRC
jgi:hypothetical protein